VSWHRHACPSTTDSLLHAHQYIVFSCERKQSRTPLQVFGATESLPSAPISVRISNLFSRGTRACSNAWKSASNTAVGRAISSAYHSELGGRLLRFLWTFLHGLWLFLLTFCPGYDGRRIDGLHQEGDGPAQDGQEPPPPRYVRRIETSAQRCRDEINMELVDRGPRG
jgi:hypothetical protein